MSAGKTNGAEARSRMGGGDAMRLRSDPQALPSASVDPLAHSRRLREELESLRSLAPAMESPLIDDELRGTFKDNLERASHDVAEAERRGRAEHERRCAGVDSALRAAIGERLLAATGLTWQTLSLSAWDAFLSDNAASLAGALSDRELSLPDAEAALGMASEALRPGVAAAGPCGGGHGEGGAGDAPIALGALMSPETLRQCEAAGLETLRQAAAFSASELSDLGLSQSAVIQIESLLASSGMSLCGERAVSKEGE